MSSVQERLQLKRVPIDKWSIREQLCLASAVVASGDQNWMSVSRAVKMLCGNDRPSDWFSQKSCAAQYGRLLENVQTPKRKKRNEKDNIQTPVETPGESIVRKLLQERIDELNRLIQDDRQEYLKIKDDILRVQNGTATDEQLEEMWIQIEIEKKQREKEQQQHAQWLKEREERKIELERAWRPTAMMSPSHSPLKGPQLNIKIKSEETENEDGTSKQGTSPLLTSLLKSPSPAPNPSCNSILHTSSISSSTNANATRVSAPTITNLLTGTVPNITAPLPSTPGSGTTPQSSPFPLHIQKQPLTGPVQAIDQNLPAISAATVSPSQAAPTLSMLLENKKESVGTQQRMPPLVRIESQQPPQQRQQHVEMPLPKVTEQIMEIKTENPPVNEGTTAESADSPLKEDEQHLMEVFNGLIPDNIDELADILTENNAIILNSELLEEESILENVESLIDDENIDIKTELVSEIKVKTETDKAETSDTKDSKEFDTNSPDDKSLIKKELKTDPPSPLEPQNFEAVVLIRDDDNSDFSNDVPLSKLIAAKNESSDQQKLNLEKEFLKKEEPDTFESDSNDDKCLESIKREIRGLSGLKENSDNSNEGIECSDDIIEQLEQVKHEDLGSEKAESDESITRPEIESNTIEIIETDKPHSGESNEKSSSTIELDEIVEIKDDKSDDGKTETVIIIEETDDANSEETVSDDVKIENEPQKSEEIKATGLKQDEKEHKSSSDEEFFEDAKDNVEEIKCESESGPKSVDNTITIIDTDDDSPMEVIKEDKSGKTKKDYSRKKQDLGVSSADKQRSDETTISDDSKANLSVRMKLKDRERSESPYVDDDGTDSIPRSRRRYSSTPNIDSLPNSPASSDDREYRAWKKSILMVYNRLSNHKYSSIFLKPITEEQAPGYKSTIYRPMDLQTIKRNIELGVIRTTAEFQRDVMLMCYNTIFYNGRDNSARTMAEEMMSDAIGFIETIMENWKKESEKTISSASSSSSGTKLMRGRKSPRMPVV